MITGNSQLFFGTSVGKTFKVDADIFTDNGTPIALRIKTKEYYLSGPNQIDEIERIYAYSDEPKAIVLTLSLDSGQYETIGSVQDIVHKFDVWQKCYHFSLGLDDISSDNIKFKGFNIEYTPQTEIL